MDKLDDMNEEFKHDCMYYRGRILTGKCAHFCNDWDGLPVDETCEEFKSCHCDISNMSDSSRVVR